jgi:hypothetical protein
MVSRIIPWLPPFAANGNNSNQLDLLAKIDFFGMGRQSSQLPYMAASSARAGMW